MILRINMGYAPQNHLLNILCQGDAGCLVWSRDGRTNIIEMNADIKQ